MRRIVTERVVELFAAGELLAFERAKGKFWYEIKEFQGSVLLMRHAYYSNFER